MLDLISIWLMSFDFLLFAFAVNNDDLINIILGKW